MSTWCNGRRGAGARIAFVPTMGCLHRGHESLIKIASDVSDDVVVSIFINPIQFDNPEDLDRYPRNVARDYECCERLGVSAVFAPSVDELYRAGDQTRVCVPQLSRDLCGRHRLGHFTGVSTVVCKLLNIIGPCTAIFGEKDYQQLQVVRQMVEDLLLPVEIVGAPLIRDDDGLALSSRNKRLSKRGRLSATVLYRALKAVRAKIRATKEISRAIALRQIRLLFDQEPGAHLEYAEICDPKTLVVVDPVRLGEGSIIAIAARVEGIRLIDNIWVD